MNCGAKNIMERINGIDVEDLQYVESDLSFYQLVSLSFLLYGAHRNAYELILQKLIILAQHPPQGKGFTATGQFITTDILGNYAKLNPQNWRLHVVEALAIIRAKRVLRKLGISWQEVYHHYLPHVAEISVYIHPLLKVLYKICERLTPDQAGRLISYIHTKYSLCQYLRFYDFSYLEVFLIHWLSKGVLDIGNKPDLSDCNVQILIEYFKFNDMHSLKDLLLETINAQYTKKAEAERVATLNEAAARDANKTFMDSGISMSRVSSAAVDNDVAVSSELDDNNLTKETIPTMMSSCLFKRPVNPDVILENVEKRIASINTRNYEEVSDVLDDFDAAERYKIDKANAGYILIINQNTFYEETDPALKHLLPEPKFKHTRNGTDVDRDKLKELFSSYGYIPLVHNNLTHLEMLHEIRETVKKSLLKDSIIICILTHGMEGAVYGCNCIPVTITEIKEILTADTLMGKPKLGLIQACQRNDPKVDTTSSKVIQNFSPDAYADMLLAMSAIKGTESLRDPAKGSWFIESICKFVQKYGKRKHMLDILTAVTNDISQKRTAHDDVMLPETSTTLRKELYLPS